MMESSLERAGLRGEQFSAYWRISNHRDLTGLGGERSDGRWHTADRGKRIVYLAEHPAVALIEVLVNIEGNPGLLPDTFQLMKVAGQVSAEVVDTTALTLGWREDPAETQTIGDRWLKEERSVLLEVPSVPSPESLNYILNPLHPEAAGLKVEWARRLQYDKRLFRLR